MISRAWSKSRVLQVAYRHLGSPNTTMASGTTSYDNFMNDLDSIHLENLKYNYKFNVGLGNLISVPFDSSDPTDAALTQAGYAYKLDLPAGMIQLMAYNDVLRFIHTNYLVVTNNLFYPDMNEMNGSLYAHSSWDNFLVIGYQYLNIGDSKIPEQYHEMLTWQMASLILENDTKRIDTPAGERALQRFGNRISALARRLQDGKLHRVESTVGGFMQFAENRRGRQWTTLMPPQSK